MKTLLVWDNAQEAELLKLYLGEDGNQVTGCLTADELTAQLGRESWDAVLLSLTFPRTPDEGFATFQRIRQVNAETPVVLACRPSEMFGLPRFLTHGLRSYVIRDPQGDFVFLVLSSLESAVASARAEESRKLAERLREEMDGVRRLQESIIPHGLTPPAGYQIAARYEPSQVTVMGDRPVIMAGGDYYDLFRPDDHTLILLIGDASGHGLKACMSIMTMHTLIRMFPGDRFRDPAAVVSEVNSRLCENSIVQSGGGFITLLYASINTATHAVTWTSAGHPPALLHRLDTNEVVPIGCEADGGLPLGISPGLEYASATMRMPPRSRLLLYSDGLTDAFPIQQGTLVPFGVRGIVGTLQECRDRGLEKTLDELFDASQNFAGHSGRHDDTSVVLLERQE